MGIEKGLTSINPFFRLFVLRLFAVGLVGRFRLFRLVADAEAIAATINAQVLEVAAKVGETGKLYGSVTTEQLAEALAAKGLNIEKKDITILADEVKELGEYEAAVKLYKGIKGTFKFNVVAE